VSATIACPPAVAGMVVVARRGLMWTDVVKPVSECFVSLSMDEHVSFWFSDAKDVSCGIIFESNEMSRSIVVRREGGYDEESRQLSEPLREAEHEREFVCLYVRE